MDGGANMSGALAPVVALRRLLLRNGYHPVPLYPHDARVKSAGKRPIGEGWRARAACATEADIATWQPGNTGLLCGRLLGIDVDVPEPVLAQQVDDLAERMLGATPLRRIGKAPKLLRCYRVPEPMPKVETPELFLPDGTKAQVEVLASGQQFVAYGIHPETGRDYEWPESGPDVVPFDGVPEVTESAIRAFVAEAEKLIRSVGGRREAERDEKPTGPAPREDRPTLPPARPGERGDFFREVNRRALADCERWVRRLFPQARWQPNAAAPPGMWRVASKDLGRSYEEDLSIHPREGIHDFGPGKGMTPIDLVMDFGGAPDATKAAHTLCEWLGIRPEDCGWRASRVRTAAPQERAPAPEAEPPEFSDDAVALAFSDRHADDLLHVPEWSHWLRWDGGRWERDTTLAVFDLARTVCREQSALAAEGAKGGAGWPAKIASAQKVAAVERLARADRRHARPADAFDADPWILNTPGGVVDLRTGQMRPHRRDDLLTKITGAAPGGDCPTWHEFLRDITQADKQDEKQHDEQADLIAYLQRWIGYMLTGQTREHAFLFAYGPGGNGKGVLMGTVAAMLGNYATTAPMETFMASQQDRHPTDLAGLRGARLVVAQETEAGRVLAEARIKALTGGDRISARFMRGDFFEFVPAFKLVMVGNHRPVIRNPDDAMRRRLHLLPLTYRPPQPDATLPVRLLAELPGILAWAIEGCMAWQREGLGLPKAVKEATDSYFAEQDLLAQWIAERCEVKRGAKSASSALFRDWKAWAEARGEIPGTGKAFSAALERHHAKAREAAGVMFLGVRLLPSDTGVWS